MVVMEEETQEYCGREGMMKGREGGVRKKSCEGTNNAVGVRQKVPFKGVAPIYSGLRVLAGVGRCIFKYLSSLFPSLLV